MPKVFINFRGKDQAGYAALLDRELTKVYGAGAVFLSSRSIVPGDDFVNEILQNVPASRILLVVIGPGWLTQFESSNPASPDGAVDWVHLEIAEAFKHGVRVIPVLVEGVTMPAESALPNDIVALSRCQYLRLHHRNIRHDVSRIVEEVQRFLEAVPRNQHGHLAAAQGERELFRLADRPHQRCRLGVITGTIREVRSVAIWVNSENTDMEMSRFSEFSVSAIIRYLGARRDSAGRVVEDVIGKELAARVGAKRPVAAGTIAVTGAGALTESHNVRNIIHAATVQGEPGAGFRQVRDLGACVKAVLAAAEHLAMDEQRRTILLPIFGVGVGRAEVMPTVTAMVFAAVDYLAMRPDTRLRAVYFLAHTESELVALEQVMTTSPRLVAAGDEPPPDTVDDSGRI